MNFLFTCGGTAGHINPALAVAGILRDRMPDCGILFVGANGKMETDLVPRAGYDIVTVEVTNIHRSLKPAEIAYNFRSLHNARQATKDARKIIEDFQPDIAIGTGGYVCYPVLKAAAQLGIPTIVHESNAVPGLTTKGLSKVVDRVEKFSVLRATMAIDRADVCLIMIDANDGVTEQDTKVAGLAHEAGKACIIVVNKWDAIEKDGKTMDKMRQDVMRDLSYMTYAPIVFISALTGQRVPRLFQLIQYVNDQASMRITTGMLNSLLADATARVQPPTDKGRRLKIYYMTQAGIRPPHFVCFCNDAKLFHFSYQRYLENQIRATFGLEGTPIRLTIRQKGDKED